MIDPPPAHPLRRVVDVLGLLAHGAAFLWIPLLMWGPGNHESSDQPRPKNESPAQWSHLSLPERVVPPIGASPRLQDLALGERSTPVASTGAGAETAPPGTLFNGTSPAPDSDLGGGDRLTSLPLPLRGAAALGGEVTLSDLNAKPVPVAVRAERLQWSRSNDPLTPLPRHWREEMRSALQAEAKQIEAQVVRLPAPHLAEPEEVPLAINSRGEATSLVQPASPPSRELVEQWASRQAPPPEGSGRAVVVTLEPIDQGPAPAANAVSSLPPAPTSEPPGPEPEPEPAPGDL